MAGLAALTLCAGPELAEEARQTDVTNCGELPQLSGINGEIDVHHRTSECVHR